MKNTLKNHSVKSSDTVGCGETKILEATERIKAYNKELDTWEKRKKQEVNSIVFDEHCLDLMIANSPNRKINEPILATFFNSQESIKVGLFLMPNQFDVRNIQDQFIADFESIRDQFDALLFMNKDSSFSDFGFKEIVSNDGIAPIAHFRNSCFDFENFKDVFKPKSNVIMRTAIASGANRAMEAITSAFEVPDFYSTKTVEIKNTIVCVASGNHRCTNDELNSIGIYSLHQIKRGASLIHNTIEDMSLGNDIRVSVFISGFDITA